MLTDLYLLETYFEEPFTGIYERDLVRRYGPQEVERALQDGLIERCALPCVKNAGNCLCRLSEKGRRCAGTGKGDGGVSATS